MHAPHYIPLHACLLPLSCPPPTQILCPARHLEVQFFMYCLPSAYPQLLVKIVLAFARHTFVYLKRLLSVQGQQLLSAMQSSQHAYKRKAASSL